jgi:hypothetical protein
MRVWIDALEDGNLAISSQKASIFILTEEMR